MAVEQIAEEALSLPSEARALLAHRLVESLDPAEDGYILQLWAAEALRRRDDHLQRAGLNDFERRGACPSQARRRPMRYELHPEALDDFEDAARFYAGCQVGLELRFIA